MSIEHKKDYPFAFDSEKCSTCGARCCRGGRGYVWLRREDIERLCVYLQIDFNKLEKGYLKKVNYRYSLLEKPINKREFACIFLDEKTNRCSVYPARPLQCRSFPFWDSLKEISLEELQKECPGIIGK